MYWGVGMTVQQLTEIHDVVSPMVLTGKNYSIWLAADWDPLKVFRRPYNVAGALVMLTGMFWGVVNSLSAPSRGSGTSS